jgi:hypothetical protein
LLRKPALTVFEQGLGHLKLSHLTVGTVTKFRDDLRTHGVGMPTTRKMLSTLQVMLAYGISLDLLAFITPRAMSKSSRPAPMTTGRSSTHSRVR